MAGLASDAAPPDTGTGVAAGPAPGVAVPVVAAGPTNDMDVGTADGLLPGGADATGRGRSSCDRGRRSV